MRLFSTPRRGDRSRRARAHASYCLEPLEPRLLFATFIVNSLADNTIQDDGKTTLREAIQAANANKEDIVDEIIFGVRGAIRLTQGPLFILDDVTITGLGAKRTAIDAQGNSEALFINELIINDSTAIDVTLRGLTIRNGAASGGGGGIFNNENLTVLDSVIRNNSASGSGGGISNANGTLRLINSLVRNNFASGGGGGISNAGRLVILNTTVRNNHSGIDGGGISNDDGIFTADKSLLRKNSAGGNGGGIFNNSGDMTLGGLTLTRNQAQVCGGAIANIDGDITIANNTLRGNTAVIFGGGLYNTGGAQLTGGLISGNSAASDGGGLFSDTGSLAVDGTWINGNSTGSNGGGIFLGGGTLDLQNTTLSRNRTPGDGGGIFNVGGNVDILNSTVSGNRAHLFGGGIVNFSGADMTVHNSTIASNRAGSGNEGGGIFNLGSTRLFSTIVANNSAGRRPADVEGAPLDPLSSFNLIRDPASAGALIDGEGSNLIDVSPMLLNLRGNGAAVPTHALQPNSPAIDAGFNPLRVNFDQRGEGFLRSFGNGPDIGSSEARPRDRVFSQYSYFVAADADEGNPAEGIDPLGPLVRVFNAAGQQRFEFFAHDDPFFTGGVRLATGDVTGDGVPDIITGAGPGGGPHVFIFDVRRFTLADRFVAYAPTFTGGVHVAAGDVNGDGVDDIITGAGAGAPGGQIKVFSGPNGAVLHNFSAFDTGFNGGVRVAAGDVNGDGLADIIAAPGAGAEEQVRVFHGETGAPIDNFFAYGSTFTGGVYVAAADVNGDGFTDIVTGAGAGAADGPIKVFSGQGRTPLHDFSAYPGFSGGVRVATGDINGDGLDDIITAPGPGTGPRPQVNAFSGLTGLSLAEFAAFDSLFTGGLFVGG